MKKGNFIGRITNKADITKVVETLSVGKSFSFVTYINGRTSAFRVNVTELEDGMSVELIKDNITYSLNAIDMFSPEPVEKENVLVKKFINATKYVDSPDYSEHPLIAMATYISVYVDVLETMHL